MVVKLAVDGVHELGRSSTNVSGSVATISVRKFVANFSLAKCTDYKTKFKEVTGLRCGTEAYR